MLRNERERLSHDITRYETLNRSSVSAMKIIANGLKQTNAGLKGVPEGDFSGTGICETTVTPIAIGGVPLGGDYTHTAKRVDITWLEGVRGRVGYAADRWLIYVTGGPPCIHSSSTNKCIIKLSGGSEKFCSKKT